MTTESFFVLKILFWALAGTSGLIAAYFAIRAAAKTPSEETALKKRYKKLWETINILPWPQLPEEVICIFLQTKNKLSKKVLYFINTFFVKLRNALEISYVKWPIYAGIYAGFLIFFLFPAVLITSKFFGIIGLISLYFLFVFLFGLLYIVVYRDFPESLLSTIFLFGGLSALLWLFFCINFSLLLALFLVTVSIPFICILLIVFLYVFKELSEKLKSLSWLNNILNEYGVPLILFCFGSTLSFSITLIALLIGRAANPSEWVPKEISMLFSNVIFDGLTLVATFMILQRAVQPRKLFSIPLAILLDTIVAALFACCSLWFGLKFTDHPVTVLQTLNVLIFRSIDGSTWHIGPCFWAMHTTFLPTIIYLFFILLCWLAKLIYKPINWILYRGKETNPFGLTMSVFAFVALVFGGISQAIGHMEDRAKLNEQPNTPHAEVKSISDNQ